ncbi:restriction endonuclease subunit S [Prevotella intermedia]|uniref:Type I restriction-modification system S subunit n=1 Tax=Prevotella intermedia ZT TaxID=1347790 RepID=A0AAP0V6R2_PREIN|nr:restriction endonuclease subunit S [Prevotella intermedia]KJJ87412.1 type I restriction-modification system S subunit [Prevotella intermedia ZT]
MLLSLRAVLNDSTIITLFLFQRISSIYYDRIALPNSYYEKFADGKVVCIDDEIPFEIPESWQWERWGNLSHSIQYGYNAPAEESGDIRMVRISDIQDGEVLWVKVPFCHINKSDIDTYLLQKGDILFARTGGTVGKSFLVGDVPYPSIYAGYLIRTRYSNMLSSHYMKYFMECRLYWEQLRNGTIATAQPNCNGKTLAKMILPIPPYNEQIRITDKLSQVLEQVCKYGESQKRLDRLNLQIHDLLKKSILQEAIKGRLVAQDTSEEPASILLQRVKEEKLRLVKEGKLKKKDVTDSTIFRDDDNKYYEQVGKNCIDITDKIPFEIPNNWVWTKLSDVADIYTGNSISETEKNAKYTNVVGRNYIGTKDVGFDNKVFYNNGVAIPKEYEQNFRIALKDSILMCIEGGSAGRKVAILNQDVCFGNKLCCLSPFIEIGKYIYFYLQSPSFIDMFNQNKAGIIGGVSIAKVKDILIPLPPLKEQCRIIHRLEELYARL